MHTKTILCIASLAAALVGCSSPPRPVQTGNFATLRPVITVAARADQHVPGYSVHDAAFWPCENEGLQAEGLSRLLVSNGDEETAWAMRRLDAPVDSGTLVLETHTRSALNAGRRNAFLIVADGDQDKARMLWGGIYIGAAAYALQSLDPASYEVRADCFVEDDTMDRAKTFAVRLEIDFQARKTRHLVDGALRCEQPLPDAIRRIDHIGYAHHKNTLSYFGDISILEADVEAKQTMKMREE